MKPPKPFNAWGIKSKTEHNSGSKTAKPSNIEDPYQAIEDSKFITQSLMASTNMKGR
jgi:hypothetical protein